jgi:hypothetical protein
MRRSHSLARTLLLLAMCATIVANQRAVAQATTPQGHASLTLGAVADQLGVTIRAESSGDELALGASFTGSLDDPDKLAAFGIAGMHKGARVSVMRVAPDKVRVEADEMEPAPARGGVTLRVAADGKLIAPKTP